MIKSVAAGLQSIISSPGCRAERLPTSLALVATTLSSLGRVEAVTDDTCGRRLLLQGEFLVRTVENLPGWWTLLRPKPMASN